MKTTSCIQYAWSTLFFPRNMHICLLQMNSDLDLYRGANKEDLEKTIFDNNLQTQAFEIPVTFPEGFVCESTQVVNNVEQPLPVPKTVLDVAVTTASNAKDKSLAFREFLGFDPKSAKRNELSSFMAQFMMFAGEKNFLLPVVGIFELMDSLASKTEQHNFPWKVSDGKTIVPRQQYLFARLFGPKDPEVDGQRRAAPLRVFAEFKHAGLHEAKTCPEYLSLWMKGRRGRR